MLESLIGLPHRAPPLHHRLERSELRAWSPQKGSTGNGQTSRGPSACRRALGLRRRPPEHGTRHISSHAPSDRPQELRQRASRVAQVQTRAAQAWFSDERERFASYLSCVPSACLICLSRHSKARLLQASFQKTVLLVAIEYRLGVEQ